MQDMGNTSVPLIGPQTNGMPSCQRGEGTLQEV